MRLLELLSETLQGGRSPKEANSRRLARLLISKLKAREEFTIRKKGSKF